MAVPKPGKYRVARRSRGLRAKVGEVVDSSAISPVRLLALVRSRVLVPAESAPARQQATAPLVPEPKATGAEADVRVDRDPDDDPDAPQESTDKAQPKKRSNKK